jgi:hypothetical protein
MKTFNLSAKVNTDNPKAIKVVLKDILPKAEISLNGNEFNIEAAIQGESARDLNRDLLSVLRRAERKTRLRAEWKCGSTTERFFDYVPKGVKKE